jgi:hypothetical protein
MSDPHGASDWAGGPVQAIGAGAGVFFLAAEQIRPGLEFVDGTPGAGDHTVYRVLELPGEVAKPGQRILARVQVVSGPDSGAQVDVCLYAGRRTSD